MPGVRREVDGVDRDAIGGTVALEGLHEETAEEDVEPLLDGRSVVFAPVGRLCRLEDLGLPFLFGDEVPEEEIVQVVGADLVLGLLGDLTALGRQELGADRRRDDVAQRLRGL